MGLKFPVPVLEIFNIYDIPDKFFTERCNSTYFDKLCSNIVDFDQIDPVDAFAMPHLHDRYHMMMNYFCRGIMWDPAKFSGIEGQRKVLNGIFAILYSYWDYKFDNFDIGIDTGIERFKMYQSNTISKELNSDELYVCEWLKSRVDMDTVVWLLENLKRPWNDNFENIDPLDLEVLHLLRDTITYGPLYCISFYPSELQEIQDYSLILTLIAYYGVSNINDVHKCFNTYFRSSLMREPYTNFTKNMIEIYNRNKENEENILNQFSIEHMDKYLSTHSGTTEFEMIKARNPLPINDQMNIY